MMYELGGKGVLRIWAKHKPDPERLAGVKAEMTFLGPPTVRCVQWRGELYALEGSHRLCAAFELGLVPQIIVLQPDRFLGDDENWLEWIKLSLPPYSWEVIAEFQLVAEFQPDGSAPPAGGPAQPWQPSTT